MALPDFYCTLWCYYINDGIIRMEAGFKMSIMKIWGDYKGTCANDHRDTHPATGLPSYFENQSRTHML